MMPASVFIPQNHENENAENVVKSCFAMIISTSFE